MENKRDTADGGEAKGKQSKMFFSKAHSVSGAYNIYNRSKKRTPVIYQSNFVILQNIFYV